MITKRASALLYKLAFVPVPGTQDPAMAGGMQDPSGGMPGMGDPSGGMPPGMPGMPPGMDPTGGAAGPTSPEGGQGPSQPKYSASKDELYERIIAAEQKVAKFRSQLEQNGITPEDAPEAPSMPSPEVMGMGQMQQQMQQQQDPMAGMGTPGGAPQPQPQGLQVQASLKEKVAKKLKSRRKSPNRSHC